MVVRIPVELLLVGRHEVNVAWCFDRGFPHRGTKHIVESAPSAWTKSGCAAPTENANARGLTPSSFDCRTINTESGRYDPPIRRSGSASRTFVRTEETSVAFAGYTSLISTSIPVSYTHLRAHETDS